MTKKRVKKECSIKNERGGYPLNDRQRVSQTNNLRHSFFAKRQMPNKREGVVIIYYIVPIHLLLSLLIIYNIGCVCFSYFLFGIWRFWRIFFCCVPCVLQYHMLVPSSQLRCTHRRNYDEGHNVITLHPQR